MSHVLLRHFRKECVARLLACAARQRSSQARLRSTDLTVRRWLAWAGTSSGSASQKSGLRAATASRYLQHMPAG